MSLSFQMTRGLVALPLLALLAVAALLAPEPTPAQGTASAAAVATLPAEPAACPLPPHGLRLALTPADLGPLARRLDDACRA